ncbi:hypothetical protein ATO10_01410 [Actibacterium atlanticum]|uniref:YhdP central domain-containing protein n=1 Tax=Actibacterium atlanticum TaxID=1461693 RepID=A0A058ZQD0_9RHOB|nr:AsmA-like C-terminal region-containing protein [Actibacterium atlanticum]KCV83377.1 hypothetical protein ATO10_01410 [Actibacterium atlanticum]
MTDEQTPKPPRRRRARRFGIWLLLSTALLVAVFMLAVLSLTERTLSMPDWVSARVESRLNASLAPASVTIGALDVEFSRQNPPRVLMRDLLLTDMNRRPLVQVPEVHVTLAGDALMRGAVELRSVELTGAQFLLRRDENGEFDLALGETVEVVEAPTIAQVLEQIDAALEVPALANVDYISADALGLTYVDARAGREWQIFDGLLALSQDDQNVDMQLFFSLDGLQGAPSEVAITFDKVKGELTSNMSTNFSDLPAGDIATQSPALAFLTVIDAPISGAVRTGVNADGSLAPLSAALEIGSGALRPVQEAAPIRFDQGKAYFSYAPENDKITIDEMSLSTAALTASAEGHAYLRDQVNGWPTSLVTQMRLRELILTPEGVFAEPARFESGAVDLKLALDPFTVTLGQVQLSDPEGAQYRGAGTISARSDGWQVAVDLQLDQITEAALLGMWPVNLVPKTRTWVENNVHGGEIHDVKAALRLKPGVDPVANLSYEFRDATVRFMKSMPPVENGAGYSSIADNSFTLVVESGQVTAPEGGLVEAAGTVVHVPDIRQRPARGEITLKTESGLQAMLSLLDLPPFQIMTRAGQTPDLAEGRARTVAKLKVPFVKGTQPKDVDYTVAGTLINVRSDKLVKGRVLAARTLELRADTTEVTIGGQATLDGIPVQGLWSQRIGPEHKGQSRVEGTVALSQAAVDAFKIGLPKGTVLGEGVGDITLDLAQGAPATFALSSDLNRVGLSLPSIGWSKPRNATGRLQVAGTLGPVPTVDTLELEASGLEAQGGRVNLREDGSLQELQFERVRLGGWLDAPVEITGQGAGQPLRTALTGGSIDLRRSSLLSGGGAGSGSAGAQIDLALDRLTVSNGIALRNVNGVLLQSGGLRGDFTATIGGAPLSVSLTPAEQGPAIRVRSNNAGGVLRGAGIFEKSNGGEMNLQLTPRAAQGAYDGRLLVNNTRVSDAPALAELLSALSIVGLLEMMTGEGLVFTTVDMRFGLTPAGLTVKSGSAVGPSLGISMEGIYDFGKNWLDMQGVVSPIYVVNSVGRVISKRGEGLFGFNYSIKGNPDAPRVRVNPLSLFTPGIFREIFRSPPPELPQ